MKKRGKWQSLVGLPFAALFIYWAFFMEGEQAKRLFPIIFGVMVFSSIIGFIYSHYSGRGREEDLKEFGAGTGLLPSPKEGYSAFLKKIKWSGLFGGDGLVKASPRSVRHMMQGNIDSADVAIFDRVTTSGPAPTGGSEVLTTVVLFESTLLSLPYFLLRPKSILEKAESALGVLQDIESKIFPGFSKYYILISSFKEEVRNLFNIDVLFFFANHPGWTVEGFEAQLLVYQEGIKIASKEEMQKFLQETHMIFQMFQ